MYCVRCGKQIPERDDFTCDECRAKAARGTSFEYAENAEFFAPPRIETPPSQAEQVRQTEQSSQPSRSGQNGAYYDENGYNRDGYYKKDFSEPPRVKEEPFDATKTGFGKALTATIVGVVGMLAAMIAFELSVFALAGETSGLAILATVVSLGMGVLSLVFGLQSIRRFKAFRTAGLKKPVATLILGIIGIATAAYALLFVYFSYSFLSCGVAIY